MEQCCNIYENTSFCGESGGSLHPGGLALTEEALTASAVLSGSTILDLGCGSGRTVEWLLEKGYLAEGLDASAVLIEEGLTRSSGLPIRVGNSDRLPYLDQMFDAVLLECTFTVFHFREVTLKEIYRVLKPDGKLIICDFYLLPQSKDKKLSLALLTCLNGILTKELLLEKLAQYRLDLITFEDKNYIYKKLLFDIIMEHGSLDLFWRQICAEGADACQTGLKGNKLSYFYGIWQRS